MHMFTFFMVITFNRVIRVTRIMRVIRVKLTKVVHAISLLPLEDNECKKYFMEAIS